MGITDYTLCIHHLMDTYGFDSYGYYLMEITGTVCDQGRRGLFESPVTLGRPECLSSRCQMAI